MYMTRYGQAGSITISNYGGLTDTVRRYQAYQDLQALALWKWISADTVGREMLCY